MATNAAQARIFGSDNDAVFIAPLGTALPTGLAEPGAGFEDVGWLHSDGITVGGDTNVEKFRGHQGGRIVRTKVTESNTTFQFQCLETTALTLGLQFNILDTTTAANVTTMNVSSGRNVETRAFVIDVYDEDATTIQYRFAIPRGEIGERSEFKIANTDITGYTFTVEVIGDYKILTNDPALKAPAGDDPVVDADQSEVGEAEPEVAEARAAARTTTARSTRAAKRADAS